VKLQVLAQYAGQSFRLLAVAGGILSHVSPAELAGMDQQQAEARCGPLDLLGLQVLSNCLRPSSQQTITHLRDRSAICAFCYCYLVIIGLLFKAYPNGCQQVLLRLRPYPVRGHCLL